MTRLGLQDTIWSMEGPVPSLAEYVSKGLYTTSEVARLIGSDPRSVRRWAFGYRQRREYEPAIATKLGKLEGNYALTFVEMIELLSIREALDAGLSWPKLRRALPTIRRLSEVEHPLATKAWFADPGGLFVELLRKGEPSILVDLQGDGQIAMMPALRHYLKRLEFGPDDVATSWRPAGEDEPIIINPQVAFGQPVIVGTTIRTDVLYRMHRGGESTDMIAWAHNLAPAQVEAAIRYEDSRAA